MAGSRQRSRPRTRESKKPIDWLFPGVRQRILALLLGNPDQKWHLRDVARRTGRAVGTVRRELTGLTQAGILTRAQAGNRTYYQANRSCPLFPELSGLLRKTAGLADVLREALAPLADKITVAFVHGSHASGTADSASDVDVLIVGNVAFGDVVSALATTQDRLGREVNPSVYPPGEFERKAAARNHFLETVLAREKIFLLGDAHVLDGLASRRLGDRAPDQP
ncbi:MAG TPA: nucleotidyltransferase domain-containing protein [Phycisphaerae bacterium]|nr:nucleotidyltransferase domain-containing protein [Phycisphaerae bacterium]